MPGVSRGPYGGIAAPAQFVQNLVTPMVEEIAQLDGVIAARSILMKRLGVEAAGVLRRIHRCELVGA